MDAPFSAATLAVYSDTHPAAAVSAVLGIEPARMFEIGDENRSPKTGRLYGFRKHSAWLYSSADAHEGADGFTALRELLANLGDLAALGAALATLRPHYRTVVRWSGTVSAQGNFELEASVIADLAQLGCDLYGTAHHEDLDETDSLPS